MQRRTLPPLSALRAFDAAARHLSFKEAANELCVTPSAVSHHIQHLEDYLQTRLFHRYNRRLVLTDAGVVYLANIKVSLDDIESATRDVAELGEGELLTFSAPPMIMQMCLIPKVKNLHQIMPHLNLRFVDTLRYVDFVKEQIDAAIWYGHGDWPDVYQQFLFQEDLCLVCSPKLLKQGPPLEGVQDLKHYTLIHTERRLVHWSSLLNELGYDDIDGKRGLRFLHSTHALQAAVHGLGVALANRKTLSEYFKKKMLVVPFELDLSKANIPSFYFVCPQNNINVEKVMIANRWVNQVFSIDQ